jgi:hypothetical protein
MAALNNNSSSINNKHKHTQTLDSRSKLDNKPARPRQTRGTRAEESRGSAEAKMGIPTQYWKAKI